MVVNGLDPAFPSKKLRVRRREVPWRPNPGSRVGLNRGRQRPQSEEGWALKPVGLGGGGRRRSPPVRALPRCAPVAALVTAGTTTRRMHLFPESEKAGFLGAGRGK